MVSMQHRAVEDLQRQRVLHQLLDGALQRTRSEVGVVAYGEQQLFGGVGELERSFALGQQTPQVFETQLDDLHQLIFPQGTEDDNVIHAVEELGLEVSVQRVHHL